MHVTSLLLYNVQFHCTPPPRKVKLSGGLNFVGKTQ